MYSMGSNELLISDSDAFKSITMGNIFSDNTTASSGRYDVRCNAVLVLVFVKQILGQLTVILQKFDQIIIYGI